MANSWALDFLQHVLPAVQVDSWAAAIVAPVDEELYKGAGLVIIYLMARSEFDSVMDGLVYGAMIGLGFQVVENVQYFMLAAGESGGRAGRSGGQHVLLAGGPFRALQPHAVQRASWVSVSRIFVTQRERP